MNPISSLFDHISYAFTIGGVETVVPVPSEAIAAQQYAADLCGVRSSWTLQPREHGYSVRLTLNAAPGIKIQQFCAFRGSLTLPEGMTAAIIGDLNKNFTALEDGAAVTSQSLYLYKAGEGVMARSVYPLDFRDDWTAVRQGSQVTISQNIVAPESYSVPTLSSPEDYIAVGPLGPAMQEYFSLLPQVWHGQEPVVGYNTWDYYFTDISEECVEENLQVIEKTPFLRENLRYFTLDDGWQAIQGDWYPNFRFPKGLTATAERIRQAGLIPGIWSAPLHVWTLCSYAQRRMTGYLRDEYGDPVQQWGMFVLDPTHPDTIAFVRDLYTRLYAAGFRLYKVDYLNAILQTKRFYDKTATPYGALRALFRLIRECVHDSVIIGCSLPAEAACPEADCGRTGIDIHINWNHACWAMESLQNRWGEHNRIWVNDIDFLVVRGRDTDNDPQRNTLDPARHNPGRGRWRSGEDFSLDEARSWAAMVLLSGGNVNLSDRLAVLNEAGLDILRKVFSARVNETAVPQDPFMDRYPCVWKQGDRCILIHFGETDRTFTVPSDRTRKELWTERIFEPENGCITVSLRPHESAVLLG